MSRVFLSHSNRDALQVMALKQWLQEHEPGLTGEIFLDLDPHTGLAPGERWKEALQRANTRCEAVICLLSAHWEASAECRTEYRTAENLGKLVFCARLEPEATGEVTAQWQRCDLFGEGPVTEISVNLDGQSAMVSFRREGLERLLLGLRRAGIGAEHFNWPPLNDPERAPYRGWEPLEEKDAAVFFGRDAAILRGVDALRGMRTTGTSSLFVILGPSGVGKSSFLRAGLLPRLRRDDRHFVLLDLMRPERAPLTGDRGFAAVLHQARSRLGLKIPALGVIKAACTSGDTTRLRGWLEEARQAAADRLAEDAEEMPAPTVVVPLDQAEELFSVDAGVEASEFLNLLAELMHAESGTTPGLIVAGTIRADLYEPLQTAPALAGIEQTVFSDLKPMPRAEFKDVITGPADRASAAGHPLVIKAGLAERLLADSDQGADTLPLLALTLARLYRDYGDTGTLTLDAYEAMGGMGRVVQGEIDTLLAADAAAREGQLELLRSAFIPWLATINPDNDQPVRRVAALDDLPAASRLLIEAMVDKRLLVKDTRGGRTVIEVALESLLRQWGELARWLTIERRNLIEADALERAATAWEENQQSEAWLLQGQRLSAAEALANTPHFAGRLRTTRPFMQASRQHEDHRIAAEKRRQQAELHAAREKQQAAEALAAAEQKAREKAQEHARVLRKRSRVLKAMLTAMVVATMVAAAGLVVAVRAEEKAQARSQEAIALRLTAEGQAMLAGARGGGDVRAIQETLIAHTLEPTEQSEEGLSYAVAARRLLEKIIEVDSRVISVAFNPNGKQIVSGAESGAVETWDAVTGKSTGKPMAGHNDWVRDVAFSPNGSRIVSGGHDGTIRVWDAVANEPVGKPINAHDTGVSGVEFSPDGKRIVSGGFDGTVRVWDAETRQLVGQPISGHDEGVWSVDFGSDGNRIVSGGFDGTVRVWDASTGKPIGGPITGHKSQSPQQWVLSVALSPDGNRIVSGGFDGTVRIWDASTGKPIGEPITGHEGDQVTSVEFSRDGSRIVSGGNDGTVRVWNVNTGELVGEPMTGHSQWVMDVGFSPDGNRIVSGSYDGTFRIWDPDAGEPRIAHGGEVTSVGFSPDGRHIVSGGIGGAIRVWNTNSGELIGELIEANDHIVRSVEYSPDENRIVSGGDDGTVRIWDATTGKPIGEPITGHEGNAVASVGYSPDGSRIVSGGGDGMVRIWDTETMQPVGASMSGHDEGVQSVDFSADGSLIVSGSYDGTVRIWDADTGELIGEPMTGHGRGVQSVRFSPDGSRIVSGGIDGTVRIWDADTGDPIGDPITGHEGPVNSVAYSPLSDLIVSGSWDRTVRIWDARTGHPIGEPLTDHSGIVFSVAFNSQGDLIASGSVDGTVRMWPAPEVWPKMLCTKLTHNISYEKWQEWVSPEIEYREVCPGLPVRADGAAG